MIYEQTASAEAEMVECRPESSLVPLSRLQGCHEIDKILGCVLEAGRKEVHAAIEEGLEGWRGRTRGEFWNRLRHLRNRQSKAAKAANGEPEWDEEDLEILRTHYARGRAGAREAVKKLRARRPERSARSIWRKAAELGLSTGSGKHRPWSPEDHGVLKWHAGEKPVEWIARKLGRSVKAVRQMLSGRGVSSKVRIPKRYSLHRVAKLLGVSDAVVRVWFQKGLFGESISRGRKREGSRPGPRVSASAIVTFCQKHPEKVNTRHCDPDFWALMDGKNVKPNVWQGCRQHVTTQRHCPGCGRAIRGNVYFRHIKRCRADSSSASALGSQTASTGYSSAGSNV